KIIEFLNTVINVTNDNTLEFDKLERETNDKIQNLVNQFTDLRDWLEGEGLEENTSNVLDEWFQNGKLETIINENVFNMKADKTEVDTLSAQLAQKANVTEVGLALDNKRDKTVKITNEDLDISTDQNKIKLVNLSDEMQQALTGNAPALATIDNNSITTEKYGDGSVTPSKMKYKKCDITFYRATTPYIKVDFSTMKI